MNNAGKRTAVFAVSGGIITAGIIFLRNKADTISEKFPECAFYSRTGLLCPACGNTRSVLALMELDYGAAVGYNPAPPFLLVLAGAVFAENAAGLFGYRLRLIPRGEFFPVVCAAVFLLYYALRNIFPFMTLC